MTRLFVEMADVLSKGQGKSKGVYVIPLCCSRTLIHHIEKFSYKKKRILSLQILEKIT